MTFEVAEVMVIRRNAVQAWCAECTELVQMVSLEQAIILSGASSREIHRRVEIGTVHFAETPEGFVLVCLDSLSTGK